MCIKIDHNSITKRGDTIFGNIYFENNTIIFPEKVWNDFIVIILNCWMEELVKLKKNEKISAELLFMDGPLSMKINYSDNDTFKFFFVHNDEVINFTYLPIEDFIKFFLIEVNSLILFFLRRQRNNDEIEKLRNNYTKLNKIG